MDFLNDSLMHDRGGNDSLFGLLKGFSKFSISARCLSLKIFFGNLILYQTLAWAIEKPGLTTPYQVSGQTVLLAETAGNDMVL